MRTLALAVLSTMVSAVLVAPAAEALPDGLALTPPMGFNNWNTTACRAEFNEAMVKGIADIFVSKGLKDAGYEIVGVSPDPPSANARFKEKEGLNFDLLSDVDHTLAAEMGAWGEKQNYGKVYEGLIRSTFVIGPDGTVEKAWRNVKAGGHVARVREELLG